MKLETVKRFFELVETFSVSESDFKLLLHPEMEQTEFPNLLTPKVVVSNFDDLMQRIPNGRKLFAQLIYRLDKRKGNLKLNHVSVDGPVSVSYDYNHKIRFRGKAGERACAIGSSIWWKWRG